MSNPMMVVVNGKERSVDAAATILDLLRALDLDPRAVAVEVNRKIVRRTALHDIRLKEGDQIELVHFVGGG